MRQPARLIPLLCLAACLLTSCTTVSLVDTWRCPRHHLVRKYETVLVVSLLSRDEDRIRCEENIAWLLQRHGIVAFTGHELFPATGRPTWQMLADAVRATRADSVMTMQAIEPDSASHDETAASWMSRVSWYPDYWVPGLFHQWSLYSHYGFSTFREPSPSASQPMLVQVSLFETQSNSLIWAGKIEVTAPDPLPTNNKGVASLLIDALLKQNLL